VFTAAEEVFHSFYLFTTKTFGISGPSRLEGFILCPDGSVEDLEDSFLCFRGEKGHMEDFVRINKGSPLWQHNTNCKDILTLCNTGTVTFQPV
jgi:hypothetical protein